MNNDTHPELCNHCKPLVESSNLEWVKVGGQSVSIPKEPLHWVLRDKYSDDVININANYSQQLAAAKSRELTAVTEQRDSYKERYTKLAGKYAVEIHELTEQRDEARADAEKAKAEMVERYIASIQQEHDRWNAFREYAMDRQQFTLVARYGDVCDALKMAIDQARKILLPNADGNGRREPAPSRQ